MLPISKMGINFARNLKMLEATNVTALNRYNLVLDLMNIWAHRFWDCLIKNVITYS